MYVWRGCQAGGGWEVGPEVGAGCLGPVVGENLFFLVSGSRMGTGRGPKPRGLWVGGKTTSVSAPEGMFLLCLVV